MRTPDHLMTQTGTLYNRTAGTVDDYGDAATTEDAGAVTRCLLQQTSRTERLDGGGLIAADVTTLFLPAGTVCDGSSAIDVGGARFEFDGPPAPQWHPRLKQITHIEATVRRVT